MPAPKRKEYDLDAKDAFWRSNVGTIFPEVARTCAVLLPVLYLLALPAGADVADARPRCARGCRAR